MNVDRPDVVDAAWYGDPFRLTPTPRYGFQYDVPVPAGRHRVCVIGEHHPYDASPYRAGRDAEIGCANVTRS